MSFSFFAQILENFDLETKSRKSKSFNSSFPNPDFVFLSTKNGCCLFPEFVDNFRSKFEI